MPPRGAEGSSLYPLVLVRSQFHPYRGRSGKLDVLAENGQCLTVSCQAR